MFIPAEFKLELTTVAQSDRVQVINFSGTRLRYRSATFNNCELERKRASCSEILRRWRRVDTIRATVPLGRLGKMEDCVGAFLFLASPKMSGYITGHTLDINGGRLMP